MKLDGVAVPDESIVDEAVLAKNVLTNIKGVSPYQAVFGRQVNMLLDMEPASATALEDGEDGIAGVSRHVARLRHAAVNSIVQATTLDKLNRSLQSKTRMAGERLELKLGDSIDFYRDPPNKDVSGWRGPCVVTDITSISEGQVGFKWQGRNMTARVGDIRKALVLWSTFLLSHQGDAVQAPLEAMSDFVESMDPGVLMIGYIQHQRHVRSSSGSQWRLTAASLKHPELVKAVFHVAVQILGLHRCHAARLGNQVKHLTGIPSCGMSVLYWWRSGRRGEPHWMQHDASKSIDLVHEFGNDWVRQNIVQFLLTDDPEIDDMMHDISAVEPEPDRTEGHTSENRMFGVGPSPTSARTDSLSRDEPDGDDSTGGQKHARSEASSGNPAPTSRPRTGPSAPTEPGANQPQQDPPLGVPTFSMDDDDSIGMDTNSQESEDDEMDVAGSTSSYLTQPLDSNSEYLDTVSQMVQPPDAEYFISGGIGDFVPYTVDEQQSVQLEAHGVFEEHLLAYTGHSGGLDQDKVSCWAVGGSEPKAVIEKDLPMLSPSELEKYKPEVNAACLSELREWIRLCGLTRRPRRTANNIVDMRWVIKWKMIDGKRAVRCRMAARGFKDKMKADVDTYSGTASRWGQRAVTATAAMYKYRLWMLDVPKAFLRGLSFEQLSAATGERQLSMQLDLPKGSIPLLRMLPNFEDFDPALEVLETEKPVIGSTVAPKAFSMKLDTVLREAHLVPTQAQPMIYVRHVGRELEQMVSTHVDDLKGCDPPDGRVHNELIKVLEKHFGPLKDRRYGKLEHCGVQHEQSEDYSTVDTTMDHYLEQLRPIVHPNLGIKSPEETVDDTVHAQFMSLRGGVAWTTLCRVDSLVYVGYLQRCCDSGKPPRYRDVKDLNKLLKWLKRTRSRIRYRHLGGDPVIRIIGDSAFKAAEPDCLALRGLIAGIGNVNGTVFNAIDFWSRKQTRVCRSTFAAECHNLSEAAEEGMLLAGFWQEVFYGATSSANLSSMLERCALQTPIHLYIDAMSVFTAIRNESHKCPTEQQMLYEIKALRQHLLDGRIDLLTWIDTRDMLADALTKGKVPREALLYALWHGTWAIKHQEKVQSFPLSRPSRAMYFPAAERREHYEMPRIRAIARRSVPAPAPESRAWISIMATMYATYRPDKLAQVGSLLDKYMGQELQWLDALMEKYEPESKEELSVKAEPSADPLGLCTAAGYAYNTGQEETTQPPWRQKGAESGLGPAPATKSETGLAPAAAAAGRSRKTATGLVPAAAARDTSSDQCRVCGAAGHWGNECPTVVPWRNKSIAKKAAEPPRKRRRTG